MWRVFSATIPALHYHEEEEPMNATKATTFDADIVIKLYDLRREPRMRQARNWFLMEFWPKSVQDVVAVQNAFGTDENAYFRQIVSYWEMSASLVLRGAVDPDLFMDWSGEMVFLFGKIYPYLKEVREAINPGFFLKVETVINQTNRQAQLEAVVERQKKMSAGR
jgi:hypothetical protein